jgi:hypothetical protein
MQSSWEYTLRSFRTNLEIHPDSWTIDYHKKNITFTTVLSVNQLNLITTQVEDSMINSNVRIEIPEEIYLVVTVTPKEKRRFMVTTNGSMRLIAVSGSAGGNVEAQFLFPFWKISAVQNIT